MTVALAAISLLAWLYLCFCHGRFWVGSERLDDGDPNPRHWPDVVAVVPARDEADVVERSIGSLLRQEYPGRFAIILVDDESRDDTATRAERLPDRQGRLTVARTPPRPSGWVGKMWAVHIGVQAARRLWPAAEYVLLTDADVEHSPRNLAQLIRRAESRGLDLTSLMVKLDAARGWSRLLIPAFVYFFAQLYPFPRVNDPEARTAGAAGGCMLVRSRALERIGGMEALKGEVIDDCALGRAVKRGGPIWLGLTTTETSIRPYTGLDDIWAMVARSAYTQLGYNPLLAVGTVVGLALLFVVPVVATLGWIVHGDALVALLGAGAWAVMGATFVPTLSLYHPGPMAAVWATALPLAGAVYGAMTLDSVRRHYTGKGAEWKGRVGAGADAASEKEAKVRSSGAS
ncbi:MAG: glycosyltransferase [Candidatus Binatia bacterium]|nr:glycosyltransferase [Candidatus Binatia bacterium]